MHQSREAVIISAFLGLIQGLNKLISDFFPSEKIRIFRIDKLPEWYSSLTDRDRNHALCDSPFPCHTTVSSVLSFQLRLFSHVHGVGQDAGRDDVTRPPLQGRALSAVLEAAGPHGCGHVAELGHLRLLYAQFAARRGQRHEGVRRHPDGDSRDCYKRYLERTARERLRLTAAM